MAKPPPDYDKPPSQSPTPSAEYRPPDYQLSGPGQLAPHPQYAYQPQPMMHPQQQHTTVIVQQPAANMQNDRILGPRDGHRYWSTGLFSCCDDVGKCMWSMCCPNLVLADISARLGEWSCVTCCVPSGLVAVRTRVRTLGGIRGSMCMDYLATEFCQPCVMCQIHRELDYMGLWTLCCYTCVVADINTRLGECCCVTCCIPGGLVAVRSRLRALGDKRGSICMDYLATECCQACVSCQLQRELDYMGL